MKNFKILCRAGEILKFARPGRHEYGGADRRDFKIQTQPSRAPNTGADGAKLKF